MESKSKTIALLYKLNNAIMICILKKINKVFLYDTKSVNRLYIAIYGTSRVTHLSRMGFPTIINWTRPVSF